ALMGTIKKQIARIDARITTLIMQDQELCQKAQKLTSVKGVGERTAALLLAQMPELGTLNRREAAALAGLAPFKSRQRHHAWQAHDLRRTSCRTPRPLHGCTGCKPSQSHPLKLLPASSHKRQTAQSCSHCRHAKTPPRPQPGL